MMGLNPRPDTKWVRWLTSNVDLAINGDDKIVLRRWERGNIAWEWPVSDVDTLKDALDVATERLADIKAMASEVAERSMSRAQRSSIVRKTVELRREAMQRVLSEES